MPNFTARDMLARLPVRMADGGDAAGVSAAYRRAMETGGQQTVDDYYANLRRDAAAYLANPNAPTGVDAYNVLLQSGISTSDLINAGVGQAVLDKIFTVQQPAGQTTATGQVIPAAAPAMQFTTPAGMTSAYERSPDLMNEARRLSALGQDGRAALNAQGRQYVEALQQGGIDPAERAQMLEYATERGYTFDDLINAGVDPSVLFTKVTPKPRPYVAPTGGPTGGFTGAPSVYQPLPTQPDIYAAGQPALDVDFRASAPRTAIPGMPGQFDYTPAAKLRPATGAGLTWTPPSVTTRPRSLLSPKDIQAYGGTISASQRFAQDRALIDRNLRDLLSSTPALRNSSTYNKLRNEVMSGRFGADPSRVFSPQTAEGQEFQKYFANLAATLPAAGVPAAETGRFDGVVTDGTGIDTTGAGGYAAPIQAKPLVYGGYGFFSQGGAVKKPKGFQTGGIADADRRPLSPSDPLYITDDRVKAAEADVLAQQMMPSAQPIAPSPRPATPSPRMARAAQAAAQPPTESASMLRNLLSGASQIPGSVYEYGKGIAQSERPLAEFGEDISTLAGGMYEGLKQDPIGFGLDMTPIIGEIRSGMDAKKYSDMANEAQAAGDTALADSYRQIAAMAAAGAVPFGGIGARGARRSAMSDMSEVPPDSARGMLDALTPEGSGAPDVPEGDVPAGSAASMLDELDAAADIESVRPDITSDIGGRKRIGTTGKYVGAPEGVRTPQKLAALTRSITNLAKEGEFGKFWYERSGRQILDLTNGNKDDAEKIIQAIAITSANTPVAANFDFAVQAYYQWKNGQPIETGMYTTAMSKKLQKMFDGEDWAGRKTNNFYNNLMRSVDPSKVQGVTTDLWMMRAFGFDKDAPTDAQYSFVENETKRVAQNLGWEPQQVQAAIWVALKSRMENSGVKKAVEEKSLKNGWLKYDENGDRVILDKNKHAANWLEMAMKYSPNDADREAAKFDYADAAENNLAQVSWESIPSRTSGHMSEIFNAPRQVVQDYHASMSKAFLDDNGNDQIAVQLGILSPGDFEAPGYFEGLTSPGTQTELTLPRAYGVTRRISEIKKQAKSEGWEKSKLDAAIREATYATEPAAKDLMMAYAAARGILLKQDGVGMHRPSFFAGISRPKANGIQVDIGRPLTADETSQIARLVAEEAGHTEYNPIGSPNGVRFINFDYLETPNLDFHKIINKALSKAKFDKDESFNAKMFGADTGYLGNNWTENLNGEGYLESGGLAGRPDLQRKIRDIVAQLAPRVSAVEDEFSNRYGWTRNTALNRLYEPEAQVGTPSGLPQSGQAPGSGIPKLKKGGEVTSSRRMLENLIGKKPEGQRVDATGLQRFGNGGDVLPSPTPQELLAQIDRSTANSPAPAYGTASSAPDREVTESRNMLRRLSDAFGQNVTAPVVGSALDMTAGVGDLLQMGAKAGAKKLGFETKPFTPVSSAIQESLGVSGYSPYAPAALAASVLLPAAPALRATGAATRPLMSMAAAPGSARETLSRITPILDREASVAASAELAAMGARELAPENYTAEIAAAIAGGGAYNTLDNILSSASRGPITSGMAAKAPTETPEFKNWFGNSVITTSLEPNGKPRRLYHITPKNFDQFDITRPDAVDPFSKEGSGPVIFMTDDPEVQMAAHKVKGYGGIYKEGANVMPLYANMQNPLFIDNKSAAAERTRLGLSRGWPYLYTQEDVSKLKEAGYDGVFSVNDDIPNEIVAFRPEQVKSAIGNVGTYDPSTPVITKAKGGMASKSNVERATHDNRRYL